MGRGETVRPGKTNGLAERGSSEVLPSGSSKPPRADFPPLLLRLCPMGRRTAALGPSAVWVCLISFTDSFGSRTQSHILQPLPVIKWSCGSYLPFLDTHPRLFRGRRGFYCKELPQHHPQPVTASLSGTYNARPSLKWGTPCLLLYTTNTISQWFTNPGSDVSLLPSLVPAQI